MSKPDPNKKRKVQLSSHNLSDDTRKSLSLITNIIHGISINDLLEIIETIKNECGGDATISVSNDDYWGSDSDIEWFRLETDEEVAKRIAKANKARISSAETQKRKAEEKIAKEKAELDRLRKKYPNI